MGEKNNATLGTPETPYQEDRFYAVRPDKSE